MIILLIFSYLLFLTFILVALTETVLLSTHNIWFGWEIRKKYNIWFGWEIRKKYNIWFGWEIRKNTHFYLETLCGYFVIYFEGSQVAIFKLNYPLLCTCSTQENSKSSQRFSFQVSVVGGLRSWFVNNICNQKCDLFPTKKHVVGKKETLQKSTP